MRQTSLGDTQLKAVIGGVRDGFCGGATVGGSAGPACARFIENMAEYHAVISRQHNIGDLALAVCRSAEDAIPGSHARLMICDLKTQSIQSAIEGLDKDPVSIGAGLSGYVARTGESVNVNWAARDPRYHAETDDPEGSGDESFLASPILNVDAAVLGIVVAVRSRKDAPFSTEDLRMLQCLVFSTAPTLSVLLEIREQLSTSDAKIALRGSDLFLSEALEHHLKSVEQDGSLLYSMPGWLRRSHLAIVGLIFCGIVFMTVVRVHETVSGPAFIRRHGPVRLSASRPGVVQSVMVRTGQHVRAGQVLMRLRGRADATDRPYEEQAREDGIVESVRVQQGQQVGAGDDLIRMRSDGSAFEAVCFLPASHAADLQSGMKLTLSLRGYESPRETLSIDTTEEIHSISDPAFYREKETAAALGVTVPVVLVHSRMPNETFDADGKTVSDQETLLGQGTVVIRSKPLIVGLVPGLSNLLEHWKGIFKAE